MRLVKLLQLRPQTIFKLIHIIISKTNTLIDVHIPCSIVKCCPSEAVLGVRWTVSSIH